MFGQCDIVRGFLAAKIIQYFFVVMSETQTRQEIIDKRLEAAGWRFSDPTMVTAEHPILHQASSQLQQNPDLTTRKKLAKALGISIMELIDSGRVENL